jgi:uncharacterized protein YjbJ (UPF0337 family)
MTGMSVWGRAKAKWDELLGRAEELYGESHGDAAAEAAARRDAAGLAGAR